MMKMKKRKVMKMIKVKNKRKQIIIKIKMNLIWFGNKNQIKLNNQNSLLIRKQSQKLHLQKIILFNN